MTTALISSSVAVSRATGLIKAYSVGDDDLVNEILAAAIEDPTDQTVYATFGAMVQICAGLASTLTNLGVEHPLDDVQRQLIQESTP